jgi:hypothetical protein
MPAISYGISPGQPLESVSVGANAPSGSNLVEIRFDQTVSTVSDAAAPGGSRMLKKGEIQVMLRILEEKLINDSNVFQ